MDPITLLLLLGIGGGAYAVASSSGGGGLAQLQQQSASFANHSNNQYDPLGNASGGDQAQGPIYDPTNYDDPQQPGPLDPYTGPGQSGYPGVPDGYDNNAPSLWDDLWNWL